MTDVLELPFDQYQRYRLAAELLNEVRERDRPMTILDVGGRTAVLRAFLPRDRVTLVDVERSDERGLVLGSGAALPFRDASFDAVCAFDTLEHVPPPLRASFVDECRRVATKWVMLVGPYEAPRVVEAEQLLQRFLRDKLRVEHRYLNEHRHNGLPDRAAVEAALAARGGRVQSFGHANLDRWLVAMCLSLYLDDDPALRKLASSFHRFYNRELFRSDHGEQVYRHVVVAALDGAPMPTAADVLDAPGAPRGVLKPFVELASELAAFDRERAAWRDERDKLRAIAADLGRDLEGHRQTLREAQARGGEQAATIVDLERDLDGHRARVADLERELGEHRELYDTQMRAHGELAEHLRGALADTREAAHGLALEAHALREEQQRLANKLAAEHAAATQMVADRDQRLEQATRELAALRAEVAAHLAHQEHLAGELRRVEKVAGDIQAELIASNQNAQRLGASLAEASAELERRGRELEQRAAEIAGLRAELRSRWRNLKRGLSPRKPAH